MMYGENMFDGLYLIFLVVYGGFIVAYIVTCIGLYKSFTKAGRPGWWSFVPLFNYYHILKIGGHSGWWVLTIPIPLVNVVTALWATYHFAKAYGKGVIFTLGLLLLPIIFFPVLGFDKSQYIGDGNTKENEVPVPTRKNDEVPRPAQSVDYKNEEDGMV